MRGTFVVAGALVLVLGLATGAGAAGVEHSARGDGAGVIVWSRFVDSDFSAARIVLARPNGTRLRELTHSSDGVVDLDPKVSPDGRRVVFERDLPDGSVAVVLVGADGSGERVLDLHCTDACVGDVEPTWAPDGQHILFTRVLGPFDQVNNSATSAVLYRSDLAGAHLTRISEPGIDGAYEDYGASFAPAGYLVFVRVRNADIKSAVFRMDPDGHTSRLTPWSLDADEASVSPARTGPSRDLVVFETFGHGQPDGIGQAIATTSASCAALNGCPDHVHYLTDSHALPAQHFNPGWSPSGRHITFVHAAFSESAPPVGDIWTMTWNGDAKKPISTGPLFEFRPAWGPAAPQP